MDEVRQLDVRSGVQLLVFRQHEASGQELVALVTHDELVVREVRVSVHSLVAEVTDVGDALHVRAVVTRHEVRERRDDRGTLETGEDPVARRHVGRAKDEVGGGLDGVNEAELVRLVGHAARGDGVPDDEASVSSCTQLHDHLAVFLVLQRVGEGVQEDRLGADVVHAAEVLVSFLSPTSLELQHLCGDRRAGEVDLVLRDVGVAFRVVLVGDGDSRAVKASRGDTGDDTSRVSDGTTVDRCTAGGGDEAAVAVVDRGDGADGQLDSARTNRRPLEGRACEGATRRSVCGGLIGHELAGVVIAVNCTLLSTPDRSAGWNAALTSGSHDVEVNDLGDGASHWLQCNQLVDHVILRHVCNHREDPAIEGAEVLGTSHLVHATELVAAVFQHDRRDRLLVRRHVLDELFPAGGVPEASALLAFSDSLSD